jgi:hypothetical protein
LSEEVWVINRQDAEDAEEEREEIFVIFFWVVV